VATTILTAFSLFKARLEATAIQTSALSQQHQAVRATLARSFAIDHAFLIGSYKRDTACRPIHDVDLMVVLNKSRYENRYRRQLGPRPLLNGVKQALVRAYPNTPIRTDGQAVTMRFYNFALDVVPAFAIGSVEDGDWYIPDSPGNTWIRTNPKRHIAIMTEANKRSGGMLKPLVKMAKAWNRNNGALLNGFHLEVMVYRILESMHSSLLWTLPKRDDEAMRQVLNDTYYMLRRAPFHRGVYDPVAAVRVDTYLTDQRRRTVRENLALAEKQARMAIRANNAGDNETAIRTWRALFGDPFPTWG
jgi:hypothetical protein